MLKMGDHSLSSIISSKTHKGRRKRALFSRRWGRDISSHSGRGQSGSLRNCTELLPGTPYHPRITLFPLSCTFFSNAFNLLLHGTKALLRLCEHGMSPRCRSSQIRPEETRFQETQETSCTFPGANPQFPSWACILGKVWSKQGSVKSINSQRCSLPPLNVQTSLCYSERTFSPSRSTSRISSYALLNLSHDPTSAIKNTGKTIARYMVNCINNQFEY